MKRLTVFACALAALISAPAAGALRLFFSTVGAGSNQSLLDANPGLALPIARTNPVVARGSRLYLWAEMTGGPSVQSWGGLAFDVIVDGGAVTSRRIYNYTVTDPDFGNIIYRRWTGVNPGTIQANGSVLNAVMTYVIDAPGVSNTLAAATYDLQSEVGVLAAQVYSTAVARGLTTPAGFTGKATLLGYYDVVRNSGVAQATISLRVGVGGIARTGGLGPPGEPIYFGVGDEGAGLTGASFGSGSPLPDAYIVPEPGAAGAILLAGALMMRRRR